MGQSNKTELSLPLDSGGYVWGNRKNQRLLFHITAPQYRWLRMGQSGKSEMITAPRYRWLRMGQSETTTASHIGVASGFLSMTVSLCRKINSP